MNKNAIDELNSDVKKLTDEDCIWLLHVFNYDNECFNKDVKRLGDSIIVTKKDVDFLNSINKLSEIKDFIIKETSNYRNDDIFDLLDNINDFKSNLEVRNFDWGKYKNNSRFLYFTCNVFIKELNRDSKILLQINNKYFLLLYLVFVVSYRGEKIDLLNEIDSFYSDLMSKYHNHFNDDYDMEFYKWAKSYMDEKEDYHSKQYKPILDNDFQDGVNSIFDFLLYKEKNAYEALKNKVANVWYQKRYRAKNKGKKAYQLVLSKKAKAELETLAKKFGYSEERMIENLISEKYVIECKDFIGNDKYDF